MSLQNDSNAARAYPVSDAQIHRPNSVTRRGLPCQERARPKKLAQKSVRVASLNVGSMTGRGREIADMMRRRRVDVLCVQETRWKGNKAREIGEGYKLIYSGANDQGRNGVGVILSKEMKECLVEVKRGGDRLMTIKLSFGESIINVISAYAPQVGCTEEEKDTFWRLLEGELQALEESERLIIGGDLNGHIGSDNEIIDRIHGGQGLGERNAEGERILDFALSFDMAIVNSFFTKKMEHQITYKSGGRMSKIDYILCRRIHLREVRDCKVIPGEHVTPQHRLLCMDMKVKERPKIKENGVRKIKWFKLLKDSECKRNFKENVLREVTTDIRKVQEWWHHNANVIKKWGKEILGETSGKILQDKETWWWNRDVQEGVQNKKEAKKLWERTQLEEDERLFRERNKEAKRAVAQARAQEYQQMYDDLDTREGQKKIYSLAKSRNRASKDMTKVKQIKREDGTVIRRHEDIQIRWKEYFERLLNEENERLVQEDGIPNEGLTSRVERNEVVRALAKMKNSKAVGPDGIPAEAWKALGEEGIDLLWDLFEKIHEQEEIPDEWRKSFIIPIFKEKGDIQDCNNYRGIKLMSHTMKIWERIIDQRLRVEVAITPEQFGFMPNRSTTDAVFALRQMMEKYREGQKTLHIAFIDLEKAYDRVPRQEVWRCLREKLVPEKYIRLIKEMYRDVKATVRSSVGETDSLEVKVGLHQGSTLSPFLFNVVMEVMTENVREIAPWSMMYADDVVLCAESKEGLEQKLEAWRKALEDRGMKISRRKTEYLQLNTQANDREDLELDGENIRRVDKFKYLGSLVDETGNVEGEIKSRIQSGWKNWREVSGVLCDRKVPVKLKGKVYKTAVRPAMLYGIEGLPVKKTDENRLNVAEMRMLRWMCGVTKKDRIRNEYIRGTVKVIEVSKKAQEARLRWYGHVMRRDEEYVGRRMMEMEIPGRRQRGRPKKRWKDCIREDMREKNLNGNMIYDRSSWRRLTKNSDPI